MSPSVAILLILISRSLDSRLFNQESLSGNFADDDDAYNLYDRPLFHGSTASAAIYKARGNIPEGNEDSFAGGRDWRGSG